MAVVAVCIAYKQLAVTQCAVLVEYAVFQYYVADYAFICSYLAKFSFGSNQFAVFVYNQFAICCIECAVAVYEERYGAVFICSTYGQVVFCVQCVGLNGIYINIFVQLNLYIFAIIAYADVLVAAEVYSFTGCYFGCCIAVSRKVPALVCVICYFADFLQLLFGCSFTLAVSKTIISSSCIAKSAYSCSSAIHNYISCCYTAACPDSAFAAADVYKSVIIAGKKNIIIQSNFVFLATVFIEAFGYSNISTIGNSSMLACFGCYFLQLLFSCSFTGSCKAFISSSLVAKSAYGCSIAIHNNIASYYTACCYTAACPDSASAAADAYKSVRIISCKINIVLQSNIIFLATVFIGSFSYSNVVTCGNSTVFECFFIYFLQLCYVNSIGILSTCCYVSNLAGISATAYRNCTASCLPNVIRSITIFNIISFTGCRIVTYLASSSVSYAASTQSNTAFTGNLCIMTKNNSVINSCFGYFISRTENNVILTAYVVIITDNLIAVCGNFIFNTDYSNIRCIFNSILITVNKVIFCSLSFSTGYLVLYTSQLGVFSVISLVAAADCHYRTACIFTGLHSFNSFFLCFRNRKLIPVGFNTDLFNRVGNLVAGTPD